MYRLFRKPFILLSHLTFLLLGSPLLGHSATYYWIATSGNWNNSANWSTNSGGGGNAGVPGASDIAIFDNKSGDCNVDIAVTITTLQMTSYSKTITITSTLTVTNASGTSGTITGGSLIFAGGTSTLSNITLGCAVSGTATFTWSAITTNSTVSITTSGNLPATTSQISGSVFAKDFTITHNSSGTLKMGAAGTTNTFNGPVIWNAYSSTVALNSYGTEIYNSTFTVNNYGAFNCHPGGYSTTTYYGDVFLNNSNKSTITLGGSTSSALLVTGKTIRFSDNGVYSITNFTQQAPAIPLSITFNSANLNVYNSTLNSDITITAPGINFGNSTFNGVVNATSILSGNFSFDTYNASATFTFPGLKCLLYMKNETYNGDLTINQIAGNVSPAAMLNSTLAGNLVVNSSSGINFATNGGTLIFNGTGSQTFTSTGTVLPTFTKVTLNKPTGSLTLNSPMIVTQNLTLTSGVINSTATNNVVINNSATVTGGSNNSFVNGPITKIGKQAFTFPVGNANIYRPIAISAPVNATDAFTAQYFHAAQAFGDASKYSNPLVTVSSCEYWTLNRTVGTSSVKVTLSWNTPDCTAPYINDPLTLQVARWDGTNWVSHGNGGVAGTVAAGTVTSLSAITSFSPFALGSTTMSNPLPIELNYFKGSRVGNEVKLVWETASELNNNYFLLERSTDSQEFESVDQVKGNGT